MEHEPSQNPLACPHCGCTELFVRRDFPQKLGLAVVILAGLAFLILAARPATFYIGVWILVAAVLIDAAFVFFVPKIMTCYRCRADLRHIPLDTSIEPFELATAEKYRVQSRQRKTF